MSAIPVGNQLYLYALLSREIGVGRQTMLSRVEEVLLVHDIWPSDLNCANVRELMEALDGFVRVAVFKKGRIYVTVIQQPEWDTVLEQIQKDSQSETPKKKSETNTPKAWKHKRGKKELKPVRPRPKGRPKPEPQETPGQAIQDIETAPPQDTEVKTTEPQVASQQAAPNTSDIPDTSGVAGEAVSEIQQTESVPGSNASQIAESQVAEDASTSTITNHAVPQEPVAKSPSCGLPDQSPEATSDDDSTTKKVAMPGEPPVRATEMTPNKTLEKLENAATALPTSNDEQTSAPVVETEEAIADLADADSSHPENVIADQPDVLPSDEVAPTSTDAPTYAKATDEKPLSPTASEASDAPARTTQPRYPHDFVREVLLPNEPLSALYQVLPLDIDPMLLLEEDWRVSRSTHTFRKDGALITFPLRYVHESTHAPVEVSMRRITPTPSGKQWRVETITSEPDVSFEGLPAGGSEAFRELAQFAALGTWQALVRKLKRVCGKGGLPFTADELRTYLPYTFHRILLEGKFVAYAREDGTQTATTDAQSTETKEANPTGGAFNTGLLSDDHQTILMCFEAQVGDIPWRFTSFQKARDTKLAGSEPLPATYIRSLSDIAIFAETPVRLSRQLFEAYGPYAQEAMNAALRHSRRDYRLATPAYDPVANVLRILLPLCLDDERKPTHALVLCPMEDGEGFIAKSVLPLTRATTCARVVSFELPQWLVA